MKIGILGGGQLGRMLWEASSNLPEIEGCSVYHEVAECSAGAAGAPISVGQISDTSRLVEFLSKQDTYVFENEFLDVEAIRRASPPWTQPFPSLAGIRLAQDKLEQKKLFQKLNLPTPEFVEITALDNLTELKKRWPGFVVKTARMGYDGKGNFFVPAEGPFPEAELRVFCGQAFSKRSRIYAEPLIPFQRELALVSAQTWAGDYGHYPLIETRQKNGVCFLAFRAQNMAAEEKRAVEMARSLGKELKLLGCFAVEFFVDEKGEILVNEMAPRVHNSGHFSQTAARSSQFAMHLKSYFTKTWDQEDFSSAPAFAMINLLGPQELSGPVKKPVKIPCYWYDKPVTSPGRKLGHINAHSSRAEDQEWLLQDLRRQELLWKESLS